MNDLILAMTILNVSLLIMHEYDAFHRAEWKMMGFLRKMKARTQYLVFLYLHLPLTLFLFYYLWTTLKFNNFGLWLGMNIFSILHLIIHLFARGWQSNVFRGVHSFIFISGWALTGAVNLTLFRYY